MKGMRLWNLVSWAVVLSLFVRMALTGAFSPTSMNYWHYGELRLIFLLFLMHTISFTLILGILKKLVNSPPVPPAPKAEDDPYDDLGT